MLWQIEKGVRCDMVCYAAVNLSGKRTQVRVFPKGNHTGDIPAGQLRSLVIRAPYGTRVILVSHPGPKWETAPWRCIRLLEDHALRSEGSGMPGVRIPHVELLDKPGAKKTDDFMETSYPIADRLSLGTTWTFGCPGALHIKMIRVERDRLASDAQLAPVDAMARDLFTRIVQRSPTDAHALRLDIAAALHQSLVDTGESDIATRVGDFERWVADR
jgi:hypothetical protein